MSAPRPRQHHRRPRNIALPTSQLGRRFWGILGMVASLQLAACSSSTVDSDEQLVSPTAYPELTGRAERVQYLPASTLVGEGTMAPDADGNLFYNAGSAAAHTPFGYTRSTWSLSPDGETQWQVGEKRSLGFFWLQGEELRDLTWWSGAMAYRHRDATSELQSSVEVQLSFEQLWEVVGHPEGGFIAAGHSDYVAQATRYNDAGEVQWSVQIEELGSTLYSAAVHPNGNVYVDSAKGLAVLSPDGELLAGPVSSCSGSVAVSQDAVVVWGASFDSSPAYGPLRPFGIWLCHYNLDLEPQWEVRRTEDTYEPQGVRMALDASGNAIIAFGWKTANEGGSSELVTAKYDVSGELLWEDRLVRQESPIAGKNEYYPLHAGPMTVMPDGSIITETHWEGEGIHSHMLRTFAP